MPNALSGSKSGCVSEGKLFEDQLKDDLQTGTIPVPTYWTKVEASFAKSQKKEKQASTTDRK